MLKNKILTFIGLFNILFYLIIEIIWTYDFKRYGFTILNFAGLIAFMINAYALYHCKSNNKALIMFGLLLALSFYQLISIDAFLYRFFYIIFGALAIHFSKA